MELDKDGISKLIKDGISYYSIQDVIKVYSQDQNAIKIWRDFDRKELNILSLSNEVDYLDEISVQKVMTYIDSQKPSKFDQLLGGILRVPKP